MAATIKTPAVYINEENAFPNSVVPVPTAVPAFIGYTPQAMYQGKSYTNVAQKISSFADFRAIYGYPDPPHPLLQQSSTVRNITWLSKMHNLPMVII